MHVVLLKSFAEKGLSKNVKGCRFVTLNFMSIKIKVHYSKHNIMSKEGIAYLLMVLNVYTCTYANGILEHFLLTNDCCIGVNEIVLTIVKQIWTQMNGSFL